MAARGYSGGSRPIGGSQPARYSTSRPRRAAKRARSAGRSSIRKQVMALAETKHTHVLEQFQTTLSRELLMNNPPVGTGQKDRIGSKITVTGFRARIVFRARNAQGLMRVVLYRPRTPGTTLLDQSTGPLDHLDKDEFVVYHDSLHPLSNGNGPDFDYVDIGQKFSSGMITTFNDNTASVQDNELRLFVTGYNSLTPDEHSIDAMCYYKDM